MSAVVAFPAHLALRARPQEALVSAILQNRWSTESVYWLKETAEVLLILEETGATATPQMQAALEGPLAELAERMSFFPQYYRFLLQIALSARSLGLMDPEAVRKLAQEVHDQGWALSELSDMQRAEARFLLRRAGIEGEEDPGLDRRLHRFLERGATFAIPNRKAAYELTHLIFYLSNHGRVDVKLSPAALQSLRHAGTMAFLDQNADLLSEICLCHLYLGLTAPVSWVNLVASAAKGFAFDAKPGMVANDDCHCLLVCNWFLGRNGDPVFQARLPVVTRNQSLQIRLDLRRAAPLRELSMALLGQGATRSKDWSRQRAGLEARLSADAVEIIRQAEAADDRFEEFFAVFARERQVEAG